MLPHMSIIFKRKNKKKIYTSQDTHKWKIKQKCLRLILECAKSSYPKEFGGLLRTDSKEKNTIIEVVILPGTISGDSHAVFQLHMLPIDYSIVGTVHSHPTSNPYPSQTDLQLFEKYGRIHIIIAKPYTEKSWRAYNHRGNNIELTVI